MRDFVADHHANRAIIHGIIHLDVKKRRLQDAGGKDNLVLRRIEIGVDSFGSHTPLRAVHRLANAGEFTPRLECDRAFHIAEVIVRANLNLRVVPELVRVPDFGGEPVELGERFGAGGFRHPLELLEPVVEHRLDVTHQFQHARASAGGEVLGDKKLAEGFPDL